MTNDHFSPRQAHEAAARLSRLGGDERLAVSDRETCLQAAEWLTRVHELCGRLEAAEAFLNDDLRRCETSLARVSRRPARPREVLHGAELLTHLRRLRSELASALPASPKSVPFAVTPA